MAWDRKNQFESFLPITKDNCGHFDLHEQINIETPDKHENLTAELFETINSLRSVRKFSSAPIEDDKLATILRCATMASSAANVQPWRFVVVKSQQVKEMIRDVAVRAHQRSMGYQRMTKSTRRMEEDGKALAQNMPNVPVLVFVFADTRIVNEIATRTLRTAISLRIPSAVRGIDLTEAASIYPAVQNLLLAARGLGIAACLTTSITLAEKRVKEILKVAKQFRLFCLVYLGYPASTTMKPPVRRPVEELVAYDQAGFE